ncbi:YceI family protein [Mucilaginibacter sp.]|uniref:YceI family protein n=1 Tax=Mucilaginibacter sp. TaxID=1882438 RepID=UPI002848D356|nr:YceI family protein [Mucilaginibacter sp.]MDR3695324.1 YceI family protein [Mucilaginibacter sp.]
MHLKKRLIVNVGVLIVIALGVAAKLPHPQVPQGSLGIQTAVTRSAITFEIKNLGINTGGSIGGLAAKVNFTPANLSASNVEASVDVNTINTDNSSRDEHLRSADFFDVAHYSKISLKSVAFKHKSGNNYVGTFILTIKDKSKQIEMPFAFLDKDNTIGFKGTFKINRLDFGVGSESMILSNDVTVTIDCEGKKQEPA